MFFVLIYFVKIICTTPDRTKTIQRYEAGEIAESQTFDSNNQLIEQVSYKTEPKSSLKQKIYDNRTESTWINTLGLPVLTITGDQNFVQRYDAIGQCIEQIDGEESSTKMKFDGLGRIKRKDLPDKALIEYGYDEDSNLTSMRLPGALNWIAKYDLMERKVTEWLQAGETISEKWTYIFEDGYLKEIVDPLGKIQVNDYDDFGRIFRETIGLEKRIYTYKSRGFLSSLEQIGQAPSRIEREYDSSGHIECEKIFLDSTLIQESHQTWEPSKRTLQIGNHVFCGTPVL